MRFRGLGGSSTAALSGFWPSLTAVRARPPLQAPCTTSWTRCSSWTPGRTRTALRTSWCSGPTTRPTPGCRPPPRTPQARTHALPTPARSADPLPPPPPPPLPPAPPSRHHHLWGLRRQSAVSPSLKSEPFSLHPASRILPALTALGCSPECTRFHASCPILQSWGRSLWRLSRWPTPLVITRTKMQVRTRMHVLNRIDIGRMCTSRHCKPTRGPGSLQPMGFQVS